jgi:hypothetical protein
MGYFTTFPRALQFAYPRTAKEYAGANSVAQALALFRRLFEPIDETKKHGWYPAVSIKEINRV